MTFNTLKLVELPGEEKVTVEQLQEGRQVIAEVRSTLEGPGLTEGLETPDEIDPEIKNDLVIYIDKVKKLQNKAEESKELNSQKIA